MVHASHSHPRRSCTFLSKHRAFRLKAIEPAKPSVRLSSSPTADQRTDVIAAEGRLPPFIYAKRLVPESMLSVCGGQIYNLAPSVRDASAAALTTQLPSSSTLASGILIVGPETDMPATASPYPLKIVAPTHRIPMMRSSSSSEYPRSRICFTASRNSLAVVIVLSVKPAKAAVLRNTSSRSSSNALKRALPMPDA